MWENLRQASFKGVEFDFVDVDDTYTASVAKYEYPYKDDPDVEDMGTSREIRLKAYFLNEKYASYKKFRDLGAGPGELIHPYEGSVRVQRISFIVRQNNREDTAEVDITFLKVDAVRVVTEMPTLKSQAQALQDKNLEAEAHEQEMLGTAYTAAGIPAAAPVAGIGLSGYLATAAGYTGSVRRELGKVSVFVGQALGYVTPYVAPLQIMACDLTAATTLPVAVSSQITASINSVAGVKSSMLNLPGRLSGGLVSSFADMETSFGEFAGPGGLGGAHRAVYRSKKARALLSAAALELRADESAETGDALTLRDYGQPEAEVSRTQTMTIDDIDELVAGARESVNDALAELRSGYGEGGYALEVNLKAQAALLQEMADDIRLRRPQIIEYLVEADTSLRLLCFALYQDIRRAPEVLRLNRITDPNFLKAGMRLRLYSDGAGPGGIKAAPPVEDVLGGNAGPTPEVIIPEPPVEPAAPGLARTDEARTDIDYTS